MRYLRSAKLTIIVKSNDGTPSQVSAADGLSDHLSARLPACLPASPPGPPSLQVRTETGDFAAGLIFEQDPEQILSAILPLYFNGQLLRQMQESVASELAARMTAMQSATDNASDLIKVLTRQMNRMRQAAITQEIAEIVAGASA